jgi:hypothetical protein
MTNPPEEVSTRDAFAQKLEDAEHQAIWVSESFVLGDQPEPCLLLSHGRVGGQPLSPDLSDRRAGGRIVGCNRVVFSHTQAQE